MTTLTDLINVIDELKTTTKIHRTNGNLEEVLKLNKMVENLNRMVICLKENKIGSFGQAIILYRQCFPVDIITAKNVIEELRKEL